MGRRIAAPAGRHRLSYAAARRRAAAPDARESRRAVTRAEPIRVLLAASEVVGFAKTGGLADVAGALPPALARARLSNAPSSCRSTAAPAPARSPLEPTDHVFRVPVGGRIVQGRLWRSTLPGSDVPVYLVEQPDYFDRDDPAPGRGLYQFTQRRRQLRDYPDNCDRFVFFCRAVLEAIRLLDFWPDVLHVNDWQTGLVPVYLREVYRHYAVAAAADRYDADPHAVHHPQHRLPGLFWHWDMNADRPGLAAVQPRPARVLRPAQLPQGRHRLRRPASTPSARPTPGRSRRPITAAACRAS